MNKVEQIIFYLLIFSIPFQRRVFLWNAKIVDGFNEWQSIFLYGTDILIFILLFLWIFRSIPLNLKNAKEFFGQIHKKIKYKFSKDFIFLFLIFLLVLSAFISVFSATDKGIALYRSFKLVEFVALFFYVVKFFKNLKFKNITLSLIAGAIFQSIIGITQFFIQHSVGLGFLGESPLEAGRIEVAEFISFGARFMRAYGTFPSPNILAAYLALSLLFLTSLYLVRKEITQQERIFTCQAMLLIGFAILLTFSRAPIISFVIAFIFYIIIFAHASFKEYRKKLFLILFPMLIAILAMTAIFWPEIYSRIFTTFQHGDSALSERIFFNDLSYQIIKDNPMGVGIGNYSLYLREEFWGIRDSLYQPVHNIFLLYTAELGWIGGFIFILISGMLTFLGIKKVLKSKKLEFVAILTAFIFILISGMFDHFYLTLQQGSLMFWIFAGMLYAKVQAKSNI